MGKRAIAQQFLNAKIPSFESIEVMETFSLTGAIDTDGHLRLDVSTQLPPGQVELVLVVHPKSQDEKTKHYDFSALTGKLNWRGDAVAEQRRLRNEW